MVELNYDVVRIDGRWVISGDGLRLATCLTESQAERLVWSLTAAADLLPVHVHFRSEPADAPQDLAAAA